MALEEPQEDDEMITLGAGRVYLALQVARWFDGAELGYEESAWGNGFTFDHPSISSC